MQGRFHPLLRLGSTLSAVVGILQILAAAPTLAAGMAASETVFPATTLAWMSIVDPQGLRERFDRSHYGQLIADPAMKPFIDAFREQLESNGRQRLAKLGLTLEDLRQVPGGEIGVAAIEAQPGRLVTVLVVDTTGHEAEAKELVETIKKRIVEQKATPVTVSGAPPQLAVYKLPPDTDERVLAPRERQVAFALAGDALVVGDDAVQVAQALAVLDSGRKDNLSTVPAFQAVIERSRQGIAADAAPIRWYIDPLRFAAAWQATNPPREKKKGPDYVAILGRQGFDAVKAAGGHVVFSDGGHAFRHHTMIYAPPLPGREPMAADCYDLAARMLRFPNATAVPPPAWVGKDVSGWTTLQWDVQTAFGSAESLVDDIVGDKGVFDDVIASLKEDPDGPQVDVENDLVKALGQRMILVTDYVEPIDVDSDRIVIALETADEARVAATIAKVMDADSDMRKIEIAGHTAWELIDHSAMLPTLEVETPGGAVPHADEERHDPDDAAHKRRQRRREKEEKLLPHSSVAVANGHLFIASHRDILERVLQATDAGGLASATDYAAAAAELQRLFPDRVCVQSFGREDETIRPTYEMLRQGAMPKSKSILGQVLNGALGDGKPGTVREQRIDGSTLPDFETVRHHFGTVASGMEAVADGWFISGIALSRSSPESGVARKPDAPVGR